MCNGDPATVVLCHLPGGGMGGKQHDLFGAYGCSDCHRVVDGEPAVFQGEYIPRNDIYLWFCEGVFNTQQILLDEELISVRGA